MPEIEAGRAVTGVPGAGLEAQGLRPPARLALRTAASLPSPGEETEGTSLSRRHCERSKAESILSFCREMDCFAEPVIGRAFARPVARNDGWIQFRALATLIARGLPVTLPSTNRGRREDRVLAAPAVSRAICANKNAHEHTGSAEAFRPSLRSGFTAYAALSPETNSSCLRRCRLDG